MDKKELIDAIASGDMEKADELFGQFMQERAFSKIGEIEQSVVFGLGEAVEEIAEELITEEEYNALDEAEKELYELSSKTLGSYVKKASKERGLAARFGDMKDASKRQKGVEKATDKLVKKAGE
ncbi:hypothetical protein [Synechococcus phage BUCT-ZZ01]|nr:hypothetical protein [Synechococcus phage BUCT-ZZ01]